MAVEFGRIYCLEEFRLEPEKRILSRKGKPLRLANRPFQVLLYLIENRDRLVRREELLEKFWNGREVYDEALTKAVGAIRKALNEPHENPRFIETRWAEGYRFIGNLEEIFEPSIIEIEKTREIKFVVEESNETSAAEKIIYAPPTGIVNSEKRISGKTLILFCTALAVLSFAFVFFYSQNSANRTTQSAPLNSIASA